MPLLVAAAPALALKRDDGTAEHYPSLGLGLTILLFVVTPLGAFSIIAVLALLPSTLKKPRYRPGGTWEHDSRSFGKSPDGDAASTADGSTKGGASAEW